ncbi:MAG TPA: hypothetical protein VGL46_13375 [Pseudonocardiaceae bacterium]
MPDEDQRMANKHAVFHRIFGADAACTICAGLGVLRYHEPNPTYDHIATHYYAQAHLLSRALVRAVGREKALRRHRATMSWALVVLAIAACEAFTPIGPLGRWVIAGLIPSLVTLAACVYVRVDVWLQDRRRRDELANPDRAAKDETAP